MARRNIFETPPPPVAENTGPEAETETRRPFPSTGAMLGVRNSLKDMAAGAVRDIPLEAIEIDGPQDRLDYTDDDVRDLAEMIEKHGQKVPVLVRPVEGQPNRFRIVYGRRRVRALRLLGRPVQALVRPLSDDEAILAQGQENTARLDPSFIEKALFAASLAEQDYKREVIFDAVNIDRAMWSRMQKVTKTIPLSVISQIGPAHGIGRRRWEDLADLVQGRSIDLATLVDKTDLTGGLTSDERFVEVFNAVYAAVKGKAQPKVAPPARLVSTSDGVALAEIKDSKAALTLKISKSAAPGFSDWLRDNADAELGRLYDTWRKNTPSTSAD